MIATLILALYPAIVKSGIVN